MHKLKEVVKTEIDDIVKSGITSGNIEILGELVDIYKDVENIEYWECKEKYYKAKEEMDANIASRATSVQDLVSSSMDSYMTSKRAYERSKDATDKKRMLTDLKMLLENYGVALKDLWLNSSSDDERAIIKDISGKQKIF